MPKQTYVQQSVVHSPSGAFALYPLAQLAAAFALGILGGSYLAVSLSLIISTAALVTLLAGLTLLTNHGIKNAGVRRRTATILVMLAVFMVGATLEGIEENEVPANQLRSLLNKGAIAIGEPVELTGVLQRDPEIAPDRLYLELRLERVRSRTI